MSSNSSNTTNCFKFDDREVVSAFAAKATVGSLAFLGCLLVILSIVGFKGHKRFTFRLVVYFMIADLLQSFAQVFEVASVSYDPDRDIAYVRKGWETACVTFGFMDQTSMWMSNCVIVWIMLYLLSKVYYLLCVRYYRHANNPAVNVDEPNHNRTSSICRNQKLKEAFGILLVIVIPFTFNWVPLLWNMYGFSGLFCWIKEVSNNDCSDRRLSTILMFSMSYGPLLLLVFCSFLCFLVVTSLLCVALYSTNANKNIDDQFKRRLKRRLTIARREVMIVLAFPLVYCTLFAVVVANRLYSLTHPVSHPVYPLWVAHVIASPGRLLVSPIAFLCHPYVWKTLLRHRRGNGESSDASGVYTVPPELDDIEQPLVIKGERQCGYGSSNEQGLLQS